MPQCSFKKCQNHTSRTQKKDGISYFHFPRDPVRCGKWISVIARQRSEEFFRPTKGSVVCSKHFLESDEYVTTKGMRRLRKTAVPRIEADHHDIEDESSIHKKSTEQCCLQPQALLLSSVETDDENESDNLLEDTGERNVSKDVKKAELDGAQSCMDTSVNKSSNITCEASGSYSGFLSEQATKNCDIIEDYSDLDSIFDTPKESKLRKDLRRKIRLQKKHIQTIKSLRNKNLRLKKKIAYFKQLIGSLSCPYCQSTHSKLLRT